jgi:hypothetical protein
LLLETMAITEREEIDKKQQQKCSRGPCPSLRGKWLLYKFLVNKDIDSKPEYRPSPLYTKPGLCRS